MIILYHRKCYHNIFSPLIVEQQDQHQKSKINIKKRESQDMITTYFAEVKSPQSSFEGEVGDFVDVLVVKSPQSSEASEFTQNKKSKTQDG